MMKGIVAELRAHQEADPELGGLFTALHTFADRTAERYFDDAPEMPHPVVAFDKVRASCRGVYRAKDGHTLAHSIAIDPYKVANGEEAAEVLAHEMVHLWLAYVGRPTERNYHSSEFHSRMGLYGVLTEGKRGHHVGYTDDGSWADWLEENGDLQLAQYILPGADQEDRRKQLKYECSECGFSFRTRRPDAEVICMTNDCAVPMEVVDE